MLFFYSLEFSHFEKSSLFISLCILRDLRQQKIPREPCDGGDPPIFLLSHGKIFWQDRSAKFKNTRKKGTNQENSKNKMERMEERKRKDFYIREGSHTHVFCIGRQHQGLLPSCNLPGENPLIWEPPLQLYIVISFSILLICLTLWISVQCNH